MQQLKKMDLLQTVIHRAKRRHHAKKIDFRYLFFFLLKLHTMFVSVELQLIIGIGYCLTWLLFRVPLVKVCKRDTNITTTSSCAGKHTHTQFFYKEIYRKKTFISEQNCCFAKVQYAIIVAFTYNESGRF